MTKVLLVDDEPNFCAFIKKTLSLHGYSVIVAHTGRSGKRAAFWRRPDIILLDIVLPDISGLDVLKDLKRNTFTRNIPVIILSGFDQPDYRSSAFHDYAEDYVVKPVATDELHMKIDEILSVARPRKKQT